MSDLLDQAIARLQDLPTATQDEAALLLLAWVGERGPEIDGRPSEPIDPEHRIAIEEGLEDARTGRIASEAEVAAAFAAFRSDP